jgi:hypothetical protein
MLEIWNTHIMGLFGWTVVVKEAVVGWAVEKADVSYELLKS